MTAATRQLNMPDPVLCSTVLVLVAVGAIMVGSASVGIADENGLGLLYYFEQHLLALGVGAAGGLIVLNVPVVWWQRAGTLLLLGAFALLILVLIPGVGTTVRGATRWLDIGPIGLQPSELARFMLLVYLAGYCVRHQRTICSGFKGFARPMLLIVIAGWLLMEEPDFGATVLLLATSLGLLFLAGVRLRDLIATGVAAVATFAALIVFADYRKERWDCWWDPWGAAENCGYQLVNSYIAIGSGTWSGAGLGQGVQKLHYLPDPHTDFIFAVLAEEAGLLGTSLVVILFFVLVYKAFELGRRAFATGLPFHGLVSMGIGIALGLQATISMGVNTGLLPTKGLTLPLISYGRTSVVVTVLALALMFRVSRELDSKVPLSRRRSGS
jgi:cell division protein FtsW